MYLYWCELSSSGKASFFSAWNTLMTFFSRSPFWSKARVPCNEANDSVVRAVRTVLRLIGWLAVATFPTAWTIAIVASYEHIE